MGSPPHTRGKVLDGHQGSLCLGITPAHAGKRNYAKGCILDAKDHPRTRGEKFKSEFADYMDKGSPPHTRGKGIQQLAGVYQRGITPAHAGKRGDALFYISAESWEQERRVGKEWRRR